MCADVSFTGAVEGAVDEVLLRRIVASAGREIATVYVTEGKGNLVKRLPGFNAAAAHAPWLVLVDLNGDPCAPGFINDHLPAPSACMRFRVAVRAAEAWLMADAERLASFLSVSTGRVPIDPETELNPTQTMVNLARHSRRRAIREDMVPDPGGGRSIGPAYEARLIEFMIDSNDGWRPNIAALRADSLARLLRSLSSR